MNSQVLYSAVVLTLLFSSNGLFFFSQDSFDGEEIEKLNAFDSNWFKQPQVYNMGAFSPDYIEKYHITVNGLWNGFIGDNLSSPFAFGRLIESAYSGRTYHSDKEFVSTQHDQGMIVPATILTAQGHRSFQQDFFEEFASRSIDGELCPWEVEADSYWMNSLNQGFVDWCIEHGKKAIDAGADLIVLDEIQGNSFIPMFQYLSQYCGLPAPGFSNETIEGFRMYLSNTYTSPELLELFGIVDIQKIDLKHRVAETMDLAYNERIQVDSLIHDYQLFLEKSNFESKKQLILALREYANEQEKNIVISANAYALGTAHTFGFWAKGLIFADLIDLFTFENTYTAVFDQTIPNFYRTKWLAWLRLASASTDSPAVVLPDTKTVRDIETKLFPLFGFSNSLGVLCAETYANKGSFVNYYFPMFSQKRHWRGVASINEFVMNNRELYDFNAQSYADVGILFLYSDGMRKHFNTYLGCVQALAESHIPFEVIFDGDGYYLTSTLSLEKIEEYPLLIIPSLLEVTSHQKEVVTAYVEQGGTALIFDESFPVYDGISGELTMGNGSFYVFDQDVGSLYFETYDNTYRELLTNIVNQYVDPKVIVSHNNRNIVLTPYYQDQNSRIVLHLVNYNHIGFFDFILPHFNIQIKIQLPSFPVESISLKNMDGFTEDLSFEINEEYLQFTVPYLKDYSIVLME